MLGAFLSMLMFSTVATSDVFPALSVHWLLAD